MIIVDAVQSSQETSTVIEILEYTEDDDTLIMEPEPPEEGEQRIEELGILIASTGGLGLLMLFGLAGRKRKDDLLEKLRMENASGWSTEEDALWNDLEQY